MLIGQCVKCSVKCYLSVYSSLFSLSFACHKILYLINIMLIIIIDIRNSFCHKLTSTQPWLYHEAKHRLRDSRPANKPFIHSFILSFIHLCSFVYLNLTSTPQPFTLLYCTSKIPGYFGYLWVFSIFLVRNFFSQDFFSSIIEVEHAC